MTKDLTDEFVACVKEFEGVNAQLVTAQEECEKLLIMYLPPRDYAERAFHDIERIINVNDRLAQK